MNSDRVWIFIKYTLLFAGVLAFICGVLFTIENYGRP